MKHTTRRLIAALTLTGALATGYTLTEQPATPTDTTWGAPTTPTDTTWGTPPANPGTGDTTPVTPKDTTWG